MSRAPEACRSRSSSSSTWRLSWAASCSALRARRIPCAARMASWRRPARARALMRGLWARWAVSGACWTCPALACAAAIREGFMAQGFVLPGQADGLLDATCPGQGDDDGCDRPALPPPVQDARPGRLCLPGPGDGDALAPLEDTGGEAGGVDGRSSDLCTGGSGTGEGTGGIGGPPGRCLRGHTWNGEHRERAPRQAPRTTIRARRGFPLPRPADTFTAKPPPPASSRPASSGRA